MENASSGVEVYYLLKGLPLGGGNIAKEALTVKFISYRKSVKSHSQMKDLNKTMEIFALFNGSIGVECQINDTDVVQCLISQMFYIGQYMYSLITFIIFRMEVRAQIKHYR
jgi:hypothetical protein